MSRRVFIHVQHLLGTGHVRRAVAVGAALADRGFDVEIASGGPPIPSLSTGRARLTQLPALRVKDANFNNLIDEHGHLVDDAWRAMRRDRLLALCQAHRPDVVITELFPFGRRALEFELIPLIELARAMQPRPLILSSLRDILVTPRDAQKSARAVRRAHDWYDRILVHGDPRLILLHDSYSPAREVADKVVYTGYVASAGAAEAPPGVGDDEVLISAGGAAVGVKLFDAALGARASGAAAGRTWRFLLGNDLAAGDRARFLAAAAPGLIVEPARTDFASLLRRCHVSVSQAGYNTAVDLIETNARAVLVPFATEGETEQSQRAAALAARGWAEVVPENELSAGRLAAAIERAGAGARPGSNILDRGGGRKTAELVERLLAERARS